MTSSTKPLSLFTPPAPGEEDFVACYYARWACDAPGMTVQPGDLLPYQRKDTLAGFALAFGVKNGAALAFHELPFIGLCYVPRSRYVDVISGKLTYAETVELVARWRSVQAPEDNADA
jgi:hypothetical protein